MFLGFLAGGTGPSDEARLTHHAIGAEDDAATAPGTRWRPGGYALVQGSAAEAEAFLRDGLAARRAPRASRT